MSDIFKDAVTHIGYLSDESFARMIALAKERPIQPESLAAEIINKHIDLLVLVCNHGRWGGSPTRTAWEEANLWCLRVSALAETLPSEHRDKLTAAVRRCRKRHERHTAGTGECVVCGKEADDKHQCDPKSILRYEVAMNTDRDVRADRSRSESDRITEGFRMLNEMG